LTARTNLFVVALALTLLGTVMVYSATAAQSGTYLLAVRSAHVVLGVGTFFAARQVRYVLWRKLALPVYIIVLSSLILVLVPGIGDQINGARRWFDLGPLSVQPAEFAKLAIVLLLACAVARARPGSGIPAAPMLAVGTVFLLVLAEPDFGTSVVIAAGAAGVLWASEVRTRNLLVGGSVAVAALVGAMFLEPYRRDRFLTFLDPWSVSDGPGYQIVQSMIAIRSGSYLGAGAGAGVGGTLIPEVHTDMIFALIGEELGLLGMICVIGAFAFMALTAFKISLDAPTVMGRCLAAGLATMLTVQATFNIGAAMGVLPLAGMTLPFVSYGGSSIIVCFAAVGILYRISEDGEIAREATIPRKAGRGAEGPYRRRRDGGTRDPRAVRGG